MKQSKCLFRIRYGLSLLTRFSMTVWLWGFPCPKEIYQDSTYQAWVSGYKPSLNSLRIFQPITTITHTITNTEVQYKTKRWGIGVQAGVGLTPNKGESYMGIGIHYNILSRWSKSAEYHQRDEVKKILRSYLRLYLQHYHQHKRWISQRAPFLSAWKFVAMKYLS